MVKYEIFAEGTIFTLEVEGTKQDDAKDVIRRVHSHDWIKVNRRGYTEWLRTNRISIIRRADQHIAF